MDITHRAQLLDWLRRFCEDTELPEFFTFDELKQAVELYVSTSIEIEAQSLPVGVLGVSFQSSEGKFVVLHKPDLEGRELIMTITHEFGHVLMGDASVKPSSQVLNNALFVRESSNTHSFQAVVCRSRSQNCDPTKEQNVEFIGRFFERHLTTQAEKEAAEVVKSWRRLSSSFLTRLLRGN